jgi:hypothetical protein
MKLKGSNRQPWLLTAAQQMWQNGKGRYVAVLLYTLLLVAVGIYVQRAGITGNIKSTIRDDVLHVSKMVRGRLLSQPEHITIDIKHENFMKLAQKRETALANGILIASADDDVPAKIRYGDETIDVRLRLKGSLGDHWEGDKWSFRIKVRGENALFGMKEFSIQHPKTRSFIYEWLYHQALNREGLISLRYKFVDVTINGKDMGIYALEEHFEKRLVEHNQLREGPIVRFNEDLCWADILQQAEFLGRLEIFCSHYGSGSYVSSDTDAFQTQRWLSDPAIYSQYIKAIHVLEAFRRGELTTSEVFDVEKLARYLAVTDLMGAGHAVSWRNVRFYYNPITSRLEPIAFNAYGHGGPQAVRALVATFTDIHTPQKNNDYYYHSLYFDTLFSDNAFYQEYIKQLERISAATYLDDLFAELDDGIEDNLDIIYREFPEFEFSKDTFYQNQRFIKTVLNPAKGLHAYFHDASPNQIELEVGNIQYLPIQVLGVSYSDDAPSFFPTEETVLPGREPSGLVDYRNISFTVSDNVVWSDAMVANLKVDYKVLGTSRVRSETVFPWSHLDDDLVENDFIRQKPNAHKFEFLVIDEAAKRIFIRPGVWDVAQSLILPTGYRVIAGEGTQLNLMHSANLLSFSPLELRGSEESPIVIQSTDSTGQGVVVMNGAQASVLEYVIFRNLSNPSQNGWELTGAVTFYESPVDISHVQFTDNRAEDALNVIRSEFSIDKTLFSHTSSDAFDADFTKGEIVNSSFIGNGNDAVDASGSVIHIRDVFIDGAGDKGLSAGEDSQVTASRINIKNAAIAVASKDLSDITIENLTISDSDIGFAAYRKKPEFGSAAIDVRGLELLATDIPYLIEEQSRMVVDGVKIAADRQNVADILYGVEYGKSSD